MAYKDVWHCPNCGTIYVEDDHMWEDPKTCPRCGTVLSGDGPEITTDPGHDG